jgi:two-component system NarL family response regulator
MAEHPTARIRVLVVDDHPIVRHGLRAVIDAEPDMTTVGEAADGPAAIAAHEALRPDVTLIDVRMPGMDGPTAIREIRRRAPDARVIVLTSYDGDEDIFRAIQAGARGYLLKGTFKEGMLEAIRAVHAGEQLFGPEIAARLAERMQTEPLTARELEVLALVAKGLSNKEIGTALGITEGTVKNHLKRIYEKLQVTDRTEAAMLAIERGILHVD